MKTFLIVLACIVAVIAIGLIVLSIVGRKMQKKQDAQKKQMDAAAQTMSILIIDKKMLPLKDSGLPAIVMEQTPKYLRRMKMPIVKAKIGPKIMTLVADKDVYDILPLKTTVKATISGIYITAVKAERGSLAQPEKKKGFRAKLRAKAKEAQNAQAAEQKSKKKK